jgi:glucoamylase
VTPAPTYAPGWPGSPPRWTSSAKSGIGTSLSAASNVWFTLSHGILNEVYYPRLDQACIRDMGLIVTDGNEFFSEEKRHAASSLSYPFTGVPLYRLVNNCDCGRYRVEKEIITDPQRNVVLQRTAFAAMTGSLDDYRLFALIAPHLGNRGWGNTAWIGEHKGVRMLFAQRDSYVLALGSSAPWLKCSAGFVGCSDGWQDLAQHKRLTREYARAENGNVALTGEVDLNACGGVFVLALGFGRNTAEAGHAVRASLLQGFEASRAAYVRGWQLWQNSLLPIDDKGEPGDNMYRVSSLVLRTHESKQIRGGSIASLSVPWGFSKSDDDLGGYHLVWPRDLVEAAGALLATGADAEVRQILLYLQATQEADGHWPQNMWLDGVPYWNGIQLDEAAFPILLVGLAQRERALSDESTGRLWPMVRLAAGFLARNGPVTQQDRWEEEAGYSPFTLAAVVAAFLVAADLAETQREPALAAYLRETADTYFCNIDRWTYVSGTALARQAGVDGYYVRIAPPEVCSAASPMHGFIPIKNRPLGENMALAECIVSPDALALVRFGLRSAGDRRIVNTAKVIDALLKVTTPFGPCWRRYNGDGYGEHSDGDAFDGAGQGRPWPLLSGERAHYELAAGRSAEAARLMHAMARFANEGGMMPEQIWDAPDIPAKELFFGRPSGAAMPLVWAHAEYVKLLRSLKEERVFDLPSQTVERYLTQSISCNRTLWRFNHKCRAMAEGQLLRIETLAPAMIHWSSDGWQTTHDTRTRSTGLGVHVADLATAECRAGARLSFTFHWHESGRWEGTDFAVDVL